jgi:hypothetical protein
MAVEIANGTGQRLVRNRASAIVQVRSPQTGASVRALASALAGIGAGPKYVSDVIPTPDGAMVLLDLGEDLPAAAVRGIPELVAEALRREGVTDALVCCPRGGRKLSRLYAGPLDDNTYPRGPAMLLWAPPTYVTNAPVPAGWVDAAMSWLSGPGGVETIGVDLLGVEFTLDVDGARRLLRQIIDARASVMLVAGDMRRRVRTAHASTIFTSRLTLGERGPEVTDDDRVRGAEELAALGRRMSSDVEYAATDLDVGWLFSASYQNGTSCGMFEHRGTVLVEGGYWWQILGEGHRARLADPSGLTPLPAPGRYELRCGTPEQWLPGQPSRAAQQKRCRTLLRNCLD